ncbi:Placenta-specific protein 8 protein [Clonorchis sinensis]|uniref:Placenta-specific gene 8 protein n=2 Tax=Clonorchis sinensis TaxID=79923 RepID=G7YAH7_CLOSI|nr:Placenta-specific protein 8 protein [Clonorchis sinensis]GAA49961.1 placenta-specific gene 8 protein [Clonorchis sinensis]
MHIPIAEQPYAPDHRDWKDGLFDCQNDRKSCFLIAFCYPCYMCYMYSRYEECCATPIAILAPGLVLRAYHRGKHRIGGTLFRDWMADCCCPFCAACQLDRDMQYIEKTTGELNI